MRGKAAMPDGFQHGVVKRLSVIGHPHPDELERGEGRVPFVHMDRTRFVAQSGQSACPTDSQNQFLSNSNSLITTIKPGGEFAIFRRVLFDVAIEQKLLDPPDINLPDLGKDRSISSFDLHHHLGAVRSFCRLDRESSVLDIGINLALPSGLVDLL